MAKLFLVRHGQSEWNKKGWWTGWADPGLTEEGVAEAKQAAEVIRSEKIDQLVTSPLRRAVETAEVMAEILGEAVPKERRVYAELNERNYGIYTGKNKWEIKNQVGEAEFIRMRRGWDVPIPEGETLKQVYERVVPCFEKQIRSELKAGKNVLIVAHGNSLRALVKYLDGLNEQQVEKLEIGLGEVYIYEFNETGEVVGKEIRAENKERGKI